jgi:hypothetical protein
MRSAWQDLSNGLILLKSLCRQLYVFGADNPGGSPSKDSLMSTAVPRTLPAVAQAPAKPETAAASSTSAAATAPRDGLTAIGESSFQSTPARGATPQGDSAHPLASRFGETLGMGLGLVVTEALSFSKDWNAPLHDANGQPVQSVPGAERQGDHDILKRHQEVVGPQVSALAEKLPEGWLHDFVQGLGQGATDAPGTAYRLEAAWSDVEKALTGR